MFFLRRQNEVLTIIILIVHTTLFLLNSLPSGQVYSKVSRQSSSCKTVQPCSKLLSFYVYSMCVFLLRIYSMCFPSILSMHFLPFFLSLNASLNHHIYELII